MTTTELTELKKTVSEQKRRLQSSESELAERKQQIEELERQRSGDADQIHRLQDQLNKKDDELKKMEETYRRYLQKAKAVSGLTKYFSALLVRLRICTLYPPQRG